MRCLSTCLYGDRVGPLKAQGQVKLPVWQVLGILHGFQTLLAAQMLSIHSNCMRIQVIFSNCFLETCLPQTACMGCGPASCFCCRIRPVSHSLFWRLHMAEDSSNSTLPDAHAGECPQSTLQGGVCLQLHKDLCAHVVKAHAILQAKSHVRHVPAMAECMLVNSDMSNGHKPANVIVHAKFQTRKVSALTPCMLVTTDMCMGRMSVRCR